MDENSLRAITSLRWPNKDDIPLSWHQARLLACASALEWKTAVAMLSQPDAVSEIEKAVADHLVDSSMDYMRARKLTIHVSSMGDITVSSAELARPLYDYRILKISPEDEEAAVNVYVSPQATPISVFTTHKTSRRQHYDEAREAASISTLPPTTAEVLLYNELDEITEASLSTVYFWRGDTWITPHADSGCNLGLTRRLALEKGWCQEGRILKSELHHGEIVMLSNCVRGFWCGRVVLDEQSASEAESTDADDRV